MKYKVIPIRVGVKDTQDVPVDSSTRKKSAIAEEKKESDAVHISVIEKAGARAKKIKNNSDVDPSEHVLSGESWDISNEKESEDKPVKLIVKEEKDAPAKKTKDTASNKKKKVHKDAPPDKVFIFKDGPIVKNLLEFKNALESISDDQFNHHVEGKRNDFVRWINEILEDTECANGLCDINQREKALEAVRKHMEE